MITYVEDDEPVINVSVDGYNGVISGRYDSIKSWLKTEIPEERRK